MEVSDLILADYADVSSRGKFTLVGAGFSEISTQKLPCVHRLMFLFIRIKATRQNIGGNCFDVKIIGEKGAIFKAEGNIEVKDNHQGEQHIPMVFQLNNLKFDLAGDYSIEVRINGDLKQSQNLKIRCETQTAK